jgi:hypothetical protein
MQIDPRHDLTPAAVLEQRERIAKALKNESKPRRRDDSDEDEPPVPTADEELEEELEEEQHVVIPTSRQLSTLRLPDVVSTTPLLLKHEALTLTLQVSHVSISEHNIAFAIDKKTIGIEPAYRAEYTLAHNGETYKVIYAGGVIDFPEFPYIILTFLRVSDNNEHD